ncbi:hypothetical protein I8J31_20700, partial [Marinomonas sp. C1424]|nr:hypothetical protein [Marinomonas transparens]
HLPTTYSVNGFPFHWISGNAIKARPPTQTSPSTRDPRQTKMALLAIFVVVILAKMLMVNIRKKRL